MVVPQNHSSQTPNNDLVLAAWGVRLIFLESPKSSNVKGLDGSHDKIPESEWESGMMHDDPHRVLLGVVFP